MDSGSYDKIKTAILQRYDINEEAYRRRFRSASRKEGESNRELAIRMMDWQGKWLRECKTIEDVEEAVGKEQFLNSLPKEKRLWVVEKKPKSCVEAGELADEYEQVRKQDCGGDAKGQAQRPSIKCHYCGKLGHIEKECRKKKSDSGNVIQCYNCKKFGHQAKQCPNAVFMGTAEETTSSLIRKGQVEGKPVTDILLDTGCSRTMVHRSLVPEEKMIYGEVVTIRCAHGDTALYPLAHVQLEVEGQSITVKAAVSETLPASVLLGTDVPELSVLLGAEASPVQGETQSEVMVVTTRAEASRRKEEEILQNEKEARSGAKSNPILKEEASESSRQVQITQEQSQSLQDASKSTTQTDSFFSLLRSNIRRSFKAPRGGYYTVRDPRTSRERL